VLYRIRISNPAAVAVPNVRVVDALPLGFKMISGTATLQIGAAAPTAVPDTAVAGFPGPTLAFNVGLMAANSEATISYRVRLGLGADKGSGVNSAYVEAGATRSVSARAAVKVTGGVSAEACVIGKVYVDCNQNKVQDNGEPGIPGVRLYMEDGTNVTTDENGQYSICGMRPITHVLKIDPQSAPVGARFGITSSRNAGDAESLFIDLKFGELHRADFREQSCFPKVLEQVNQRRKLGPVYVPQKQDGKDDPWGIQFNSEQHKLDRTPAANPGNPAVGGGR
jgi:large repetitive protein